MFKKILLTALLTASWNNFCGAMQQPDSDRDDEMEAIETRLALAKIFCVRVPMPNTCALELYFSDFGLTDFAAKTGIIEKIAGKKLCTYHLEMVYIMACTEYLVCLGKLPDGPWDPRTNPDLAKVDASLDKCLAQIFEANPEIIKALQVLKDKMLGETASEVMAAMGDFQKYINTDKGSF